MFDKAKENFSSETDITYIVNSLRDIKVLIRTILDEKEENHLQFYHTNLIDSNHQDTIDSKYYRKDKISLPADFSRINEIREFEKKVDLFKGIKSFIYSLFKYFIYNI